MRLGEREAGCREDLAGMLQLLQYCWFIGAYLFLLGEPVLLSHHLYACHGCVGHPRLLSSL